MFVQLTITGIERPLKKGLLGLPLELRTLIWQYTLLEPAQNKKHHDSSCEWMPRDTKTPESMPFDLQTNQWCCTARQYKFGWSCACPKRRGLNLLLASRQVHAEAAPIFWSGNVFCFSHPGLFMANVEDDNLRPEYRRLIQHVKFIKPPPVGLPLPKMKQFWRLIGLFASLRTLELPTSYIKGFKDPIPTLKSLPAFETIIFNDLLTFQIGEAGWRNFTAYDRKEEAQQHHVTFHFAKEFPIAFFHDDEACREIIRGFETNYLVFARYQVKRRLLGQSEAQAYESDLVCPKLLPTLNDLNAEVDLVLANKEVARVSVYGVPLSPETRYRHARTRYFRDRMLIVNGMTAQQARLEEEKRQRRHNRKEMHAESMREEYRRRQVDLDVRAEASRQREDERRREEEAAREELARERAEAVARAEERRRAERKAARSGRRESAELVTQPEADKPEDEEEVEEKKTSRDHKVKERSRAGPRGEDRRKNEKRSPRGGKRQSLDRMVRDAVAAQ